jgi:D-aspartate ligase
MSELKDHKFIVYCGDNYNALGICRSLGEKGLDPIVVLYTPKPYLVNHCKYVKHLYQVDSEEAGLEYIVKKWGDEPVKPFIYTMDDYATMLLDQRYDELSKRFYFFNCGKQGFLTYYQEKKNICNLAEKCGIPQPKGEVLKKGELPKTLRYPVITKVTMSIKGAWKDDVFVCQNEEELKEAYKHIVADELLVQEFIVKKNELCVDGLSINEGEEVIFPYTSEYLRFGESSYGCYMNMLPYENEEVIKKIKNIIRGSHFSGIFSLECLIDKDDNLWFLEVNFRNSTWSYAYTFAGINLPYYWAKWSLDGKINHAECTIRKEPFKAMAELGDLSQIAHMPDVSFRTWLKQFHDCECPYIYNKNDIWPFYHAIWYKIKTVFKHKVLRRR